MKELQLAAPGQGLPFPQNLVVRYLAPIKANKESWDQAESRFQRESEKILQLLEGLSKTELEQRILVPPMRGLEDSSRYWSIAMTLDHVLIVSRKMGGIIEALSQGRVPEEKVDLALVKPKAEENDANVVSLFQDYAQSGAREIRARVFDAESKTRYTHPWFGPIRAKQWFWLLGIHMGIHRKQIEAIRKQLKKNKENQ